MLSANFTFRKTPARTYASLQAGLVGYWPMNEASGSALNQTSGAHLTAVNSPTATTGKINGGRFLTRVAAPSSLSRRFYVAANANLTLLGATNYTASFWFYPNGDANSTWAYGLIANDAFPSQRGVSIGIPASGNTNWLTPYFYAQFTDGTSDVFSPFTGTSTKNAWNFFCVRRDGSTIKFRLNATTGTNYTLTKTLFSSRSWFHVGIRYGSNAIGNDHFNGGIDELALWNRTLSDAEVDSLYNSGSGIDLRL